MDTLNYIAISHQMALRRRLDVIANNIANVDTAGYKREAPIFSAYIENQPNADNRGTRSVSFVLDQGVGRDFSPGQVVPTANPLDVALADNRFLTVRTADGQTAYTRNGLLRRSDDGFLVTANGDRVLDEKGGDIALGVDDSTLTIANDGTLNNVNGNRGRLAIVTFGDERQLEKLGGSLLRGTGATPAPKGEIALHAGAYESSNVSSVKELTDMIEVVRSYQTSANLIDKFDDMRRRSIERLAQVQ